MATSSSCGGDHARPPRRSRLAQRVGPQRDWDLDRLRVALDVLAHLGAAVGDRIRHHLRQRRHRAVEAAEVPRRRAVDVEEALAVAQRAQLREDRVAERRNVRPLVSCDGAVEALGIGLVLAADPAVEGRTLASRRVWRRRRSTRGCAARSRCGGRAGRGSPLPSRRRRLSPRGAPRAAARFRRRRGERAPRTAAACPPSAGRRTASP